MEISLLKKCLRCGHQWILRKPHVPRKCPRCQSVKWETIKEYTPLRIAAIAERTREDRRKYPWFDLNIGERAYLPTLAESGCKNDSDWLKLCYNQNMALNRWDRYSGRQHVIEMPAGKRYVLRLK